MRKTLLKQFIDTKMPANVMERNEKSDKLIDLMQEMKSSWKEAANDLLEPRSEAIENILKKVLH